MTAIPKSTIIRSRPYLNYVRTLPCIVTGRSGSEYETVDPAHIRLGGGGGMGMKPSDDRVLPLIHSEHLVQHGMPEAAYWRSVLVNDAVLAELLRLAARGLYLEWENENG